MQLKNSVLVAALSASSAFATYTKDYKLNAYWGQSGPDTDSLGEHCESDSIDYVTLGFVNNSPENGNGTGYPGTNFAAHCAAEVYVNNNRDSKLLSSCSFIKDDIKKCQQLGKKVLLSIGGEFSSSSNYTLSSVQAGIDFADFLYQAFGPFKSGYTGPRPFDTSSTEHVTIDGFDFDIETTFSNQQPYVNMVNHLRDLITADSESIILTAAPQCPQSADYFQMETILQQAKFDKIWIQFYNNPTCEAWSTGFNYNDWESFISGGVNSAAELFIGLPGSASAVGLLGSGYITAQQAKDLICTYKKQEHFGGAMLWDAYYASQNKDLAGKNYYDLVAEALKCGGCDGDVCKPATTSSSVTTSSTTSSSTSSSTSSTVSTTSSSTSSTVSTTSTSSSASSTSSSISTSSSVATSSSASSSNYIATSSSASSSGYLATSENASSSSYLATSTSSSVSSSSSSSSTSSSASSAATSSSVSSTSSYDLTSSSSASASETYADSTSSSSIATVTESSTSSLITSSSTLSTISTISSSSYSASATSSEDDCPPDETSSSFSESSTYSASASRYPTVSVTSSVLNNASASGYPTVSLTFSASNSVSETQSVSATSSSYPTGSASTTEYTTSTVYSTTVYTVTSCAPSVTNCPARGSVVTETIALYTTVCPVTETQKPTQTPTAVPYTSTIYSTRISTITKCPASVTNCPVGSVTTETIAIETTIVPTTVETTAETKPTASGVASYPVAGGSQYHQASSSNDVQTAAVSSYPSPSNDVQTAAVSSYPAVNTPTASPSSVQSVSTTLTVAVYPTGKGGYNNGSTNGIVPSYSAGTGYPVAPTTTSAGSGYTAIVCNGTGCSASTSTSYPTSVVTAGSAKAASLSLGLLAVVALVL
ncbi:glycoside hydrolase superfamily [Daldinia vernicosa]|uniref:glycoside hydrolase superfamily n=1 Tax=Daldinia vernicosa TaxID=114800 RepID=UPI0020074EEE|nr:glycoside hydrolase superfamily [Daldinia vernicosa]KAI0847622.1 glycoside hydrolase superfamily [Daldinia vernicosa]